ncbi:MAG TPA: IS630 family transposase, partial [Tepidisphaeraceae bacterium]|nr:IS630 family transposase [Tepidisphaeraceae bacterium]
MSRMVVRVRAGVKRELRKLRDKTSDKGLAVRCQIVLLWGEGEAWFAIAKAVGCSLSWVGRVIRRFRDHGVAGLQDRREDNGDIKLDEHYLARLHEVVGKQPTDYGYPRPTWTQELLVEVMVQETGVRVHPGTMSRALKMIGARLGQPKATVGCPWKKSRKNRRLAEIRRVIEAMGDTEACVYLDEVDIHLNPRIGPDWMNRGTQKQVLTPGQNHKRYVCGALDIGSGQIQYVTGERKNSLLFLAMLQRLLEKYPHATTIHVVLDNFKIRQQAGAGLDAAQGPTPAAALPAPVLPRPQPNRAQVAGPARQRHPEPSLQNHRATHGRSRPV